MPGPGGHLKLPWPVALLPVCSEPLSPDRAGGKGFFAPVRRDLGV